MMDRVEALGREVEEAWQQRGRSREALPEIAAQLLRQYEIHKHFSIEGFAQTLCERNELPGQLQPFNGFGAPPITLYHGKGICIDVYFWVRPDIDIHSHGFWGAFTVLEGTSFHAEYEFAAKKNLDNIIIFGDVGLKATTVLHPGMVTEVTPQLIHQVWHVACPTVSFLVRTVSYKEDPQAGAPPSQYVFREPHLGYLSFHHMELPPPRRKQVDTLQMLFGVQHPMNRDGLLETVLRNAPPHEAFRCLLEYWMRTYDLELVERTIDKLPQLKEHGPEFVASLVPDATAGIDFIQDEGERFLLALVSTLSSRDDILRFAMELQPSAPPEETITTWLRGLARVEKVGFELNDTALDVFELLLHGRNETEMVRELTQVYAGADPAEVERGVRDCCEQLRSNPLLAPLVASPESSRTQA